MEQTEALEEESKLEKEKTTKYKGTARISLKWLHFRWNEPRELDAKNVEDLKSRFRKDCRRLDIRNHIPAVIDEQNLGSALRMSGVLEGELPKTSQHEYPDLGFWAGYQLECLHGRHRIEAAKQALLPPDKWWTVDLYLADISSELKTELSEEYANEGKPSDGEVYQKIREYHRQQQLSLEMRWWTRLSKHKIKNLKQLLQHKDVSAAFDSFLDIPAVLGGMRISTLHKMFATRCDEEILHYLCYTKEFWSDLLHQDTTAMKKVDQATVKALELTAPWASTLDAKSLGSKVLGGEIFSYFSQREREDLWIRLQVFKGIVPSLFTFFEDVKYLEACADCLKWLVCLSPRDTVSMAYRKIFTGETPGTDSTLVQETESTFTRVTVGFADQDNLGYRQLCVFAMRYYREIPKKPSGRAILAKPALTVDTTKLREMADLADQLGFRSSEITALKQYPKSVDTVMVTESGKPLLVTDGPGEMKKERCGMPHIQSHERDRKFLFITHLHDDGNEQSEGITSFFRLRSMYSKFYGILGLHDAIKKAPSLQQHPTPVAEVLLSPTLHPDRSFYTAQQAPTQQPSQLNTHGNHIESGQIEDTKMQNEEEQRAPLQEEDTLTQEKLMGEQLQQSLMSDASALKVQEQLEEQTREKLIQTANALREHEHEHDRRRQTLAASASALGEQEQRQQWQRQKLILDANTLEEHTRKQEQTRQKLALDASALIEQDQKQEEQRQRLVAGASELLRIKQKQEERQQKHAADASKLEKQGQPRREQRQKKLARDALKQKREQKLLEGTEPSQQIDAQICQKQEEQDMEELQRQGQEELVDIDLSSPLRLEYQGAYVDQTTSEVRVDHSIDLIPKGSSDLDVPTPAAQEGPAQVQTDHPNINQAEEDLELEDQAHRHHAQDAQTKDDQTHQSQSEDSAALKKQTQDGPQKRGYKSEESDSYDVQTRQTRRGQRPREKGKYQRLNRYPQQQNHDIDRKDITSIDTVNQKDIIFRIQQQQQQQRRDTQPQEEAIDVAVAASTEQIEASDSSEL